MPSARLLLPALLTFSLSAFVEPRQGLQIYLPESKWYALYKPAEWNVKEESSPTSFRIMVASADRTVMVDFYWARAASRQSDALAFLSESRARLAQPCRDLVLSEAFLSHDATRAVATVTCRLDARTLKGRYYFEAKQGAFSAQGYLAPEPQLARQRPLLMNILASFAFAKAPPRVTGASFGPAPRVALVQRVAQDNSLSLRTPEDWAFLGAGGKVITGAPDGGMGFIFTSFSGNPLVPNATIAQGILPVPYAPPPRALTLILQAFGHRNIRILSAEPDRATLQECAAYHRPCDAQDLVARWTSNRGADSLGAIKIINSQPSPLGLWFCIMSGIWGPEKEFPRYHAMLEEIGSSFTINDQFVRRYIQSGLQNLRRLQAQTAAAMQDLNRARAENQAHWEAMQERKDYMNSKWDDYRRGNSYWVSDLEGGKVYQTDPYGTRDTVTGDYYEGRPYNWLNFEGQNPRHPSENMRELSSWEIEHGRRPPR